MKQSFKPFVSTKSAKFDKAAQGISAWSTALLLQFCVTIRLLAAYDTFSDRKDEGGYVATDNGIPFPKFARDVAIQMRRICRMPVDQIIGDAVEFDANQDAVTQYIEQRYMAALIGSGPAGFGYFVPSFMAEYYTFRTGMLLRTADGSFVLTTETEKLSGEPATLWLNGVVMKVWLFRSAKGQGEFLLIYKGDDGLFVQGQLRVDQDFVDEWEVSSILRVVLLFVKVGEFCGMVMTDGLLVPNAHRVLCKILAYRAPTFYDAFGNYQNGYKAFAVYQNSIRDTLMLGSYWVAQCRAGYSHSKGYIL
jgi:hypothetical protein